MKILIVGGGIGGLTAALCLAKSGHEVAIYEKATANHNVGAGIQCGANAVHVLDHLGLLDFLEPLAVTPERLQFRDYLNGDLLYNVELGLVYRNKYGAPYFHLHRADLMAVLEGQVSNEPNVNLITGTAVARYHENKSSVTLELESGETVDGDILVGCDGIRSAIREQMLGTQTYEYTGNLAWRATLPVESLPDEFMNTVATNFVGPKKHMVMYYLRDRQLLNMVGVVEGQEFRGSSWVSKGDWGQLKRDFSGWHPMVETVVNAVDKNECYQWALFDHKPLANWSSKRVTLLGDAAHATLPFIASGAAMAIEDARILERSIEAEQSVENAIQRYQKNRIPRTSKIQNTSRKFGKLYHIQNRFFLKAAFAGLRTMGGKKENFLPEYDANSITLKN